MLLTPEEKKQQTRQLWQQCFDDAEDFLDIYFEEKYTDARNITLRPDGFVAAALQLLPYRLTFYGSVLHTGYISGLAVHPDYRRRGMAARLLRDAHRELYRQGGVVSFLIPGDDSLRHFYEQPAHGAFWTATYRHETELKPREAADERVEVTQPDAWGLELYVYYRRTTINEFMLHPSENDFFAAIETADIAGGYTLVARRKHRIVGLVIAVPEADGRLFVRSLLVDSEGVQAALFDRLKALAGVDKIYGRVPAPGSGPNVKPYAMARVVNVERFLRTIARAYPELDMEIGVDQDLDLPENNGYYHLHHGRVDIIAERPESVVTPGGLAALFLAAHPTQVEMMLDE